MVITSVGIATESHGFSSVGTHPDETTGLPKGEAKSCIQSKARGREAGWSVAGPPHVGEDLQQPRRWGVGQLATRDASGDGDTCDQTTEASLT